jgi:predicted acetyltransferase
MQNVYPEISPASRVEKPILRNLMELYQHDFSEYDQADVNPAGQYDYPYLDLYWIEPNRYPFLIRMKDKLAGFVLVNRHADPVYQEQRWSVAEFFIMRKYRRIGIGTQVAVRIFDMFRGKWQVARIEGNLPAQKFWRKVIGGYTQGAYEEITVKHDPFQFIVQFFDNSLPDDSLPEEA